MTTNADDENSNPAARRISMRRSRGGFGGSVSTRSESLRTSVADDEVDDAVSPESVHNRIVGAVATRPVPRAPAGLPQGDTAPPPPDPRARMQEVAVAGSAAYSKEYRLTLLHRLLLRRVPLDQIAAQLGVSISTVEKDRVALKARLREIARGLDINEIVGNQMETYGEITSLAMRAATNNEVPIAMRLAAMRTTLASEADKTRFLNTAGVFDVLRFRRAEDGTDVSDVQMLMSQTADMLERLMSGDAEAAAPAAPRARRAPRPARSGGFAPMTMDDRTASNSDTENVEI